MKKKKVKVLIISALIFVLLMAAFNVVQIYSKPLTMVVTESGMKTVKEVNFDYYAIYEYNELYGASIQRGDKFFTAITDRVEGSVTVAPSTDVSTYVIIRSGDYWEKRVGVDDDSTFVLNVSEYKEIVDRINKQLGIRESSWTMTVVAVTDEYISELTFDCGRVYIELVSSASFTHQKEVEVERSIPTGATKERRTSVIMLGFVIPFVAFGVVLIVKECPILSRLRETDKSIRGVDRGGAFFINDLNDLKKIAKLENKAILFDEESSEYFFRAEGKEYRCKR